MDLIPQIVDPSKYPDWDELILASRTYSFFHSSAWAESLSESYVYKPLFFTIFHGKRLLSLIPVMEVKSILTGRRGVSLPFSDYCMPIIDKKGHFKNILDAIIKYGSERRWKYVELRGGDEFLGSISPASWFYAHTLNLKRDSDTIFRSFKGSTRRNIKKAVKENVKVHFSYSLDSMREFYRLNAITRKHHGLPSQPFLFFKNVHKHIISKGKGVVVLASFDGKFIAGAVYFHFGKKVVYKYGASERSWQNKRPNNLVMWETIKWYSEKGFESFSFGRTEPENNGLLQFKRGWGTKEEIVRYYKYSLKERTFIQEHAKIDRFSHIFKKMPIPLLNLLGSLLYRHVG